MQQMMNCLLLMLIIVGCVSWPNVDGEGSYIISTVAGTGGGCSVSTDPCGDDGSAIAATLGRPRSVVVV